MSLTVKSHTETGVTRGLTVARGGVLDKINIAIGNEVERTPSKIYASVSLSDDAARQLRDELTVLLGEGGEQ